MVSLTIYLLGSTMATNAFQMAISLVVLSAVLLMRSGTGSLARIVSRDRGWIHLSLAKDTRNFLRLNLAARALFK